MPDFKRTTMASRAYDKAYVAHYSTKDLCGALGLYRGVLADYPDTQEADYSRSQMQNIVSGVVPTDDLLVAQVELALTRLEHERSSDDEQISLSPVASELPG